MTKPTLHLRREQRLPLPCAELFPSFADPRAPLCGSAEGGAW